jgi:transposase
MDKIADADQASTAIGKRRRWTSSEKREIVEQSLMPGSSVPAVATRYGVSASQVYRWIRLHRQAAAAGSSVPALLPVTLIDPNPAQRKGALRVSSAPLSGTIQLEVGNANLRVHGAADPYSLRLMLDYLLR